jgi:hypothetical protein
MYIPTQVWGTGVNSCVCARASVRQRAFAAVFLAATNACSSMNCAQLFLNYPCSMAPSTTPPHKYMNILAGTQCFVRLFILSFTRRCAARARTCIHTHTCTYACARALTHARTFLLSSTCTPTSLCAYGRLVSRRAPSSVCW